MAGGHAGFSHRPRTELLTGQGFPHPKIGLGLISMELVITSAAIASH